MSQVATGQIPTLVLNRNDNIAVAVNKLEPGISTAQGVTIRVRVPRGHKYATQAIATGQPVVKFGQVIGFALVDVAPGEGVHEHICGVGPEHGAFARDYAFGERVVPTDYIPVGQQATFQGYRRASGRVGTRNYVGILTSVSCSATVAAFIPRPSPCGFSRSFLT